MSDRLILAATEAAGDLFVRDALPVHRNPRTASHPLIREVLAVRGADPTVCQAIAERAGRPLRWLESPPRVDGDRGRTKLRDERDSLVLQNRGSAFISRFEHPLGRCARFYKLTAYNSCNFWCEYCYLYLTFRARPFSVHYVNYARMEREIIKFDRSDVPPALRLLNLGELGDPLAVDDVTAFTRVVIPFVTRHTKHTRLLFLTKSNQIANLLELDGQEHTVVSFSLNTDTVFRHLEHRAASPVLRIEAAREVQDAGYEIRIRIDPIIYYSTWKKDYEELVNLLADCLKPSVVTLGEYRPSRGLIDHIRARFPDSPLIRVNATLVKDNGKLRYSLARRAEMFSWIVNCLHRRGIKRIGLCKESPQSWRAAGLSGPLYCNCLNDLR
jgi:spore photoproduct lyase